MFPSFFINDGFAIVFFDNDVSFIVALETADVVDNAGAENAPSENTLIDGVLKPIVNCITVKVAELFAKPRQRFEVLGES